MSYLIGLVKIIPPLTWVALDGWKQWSSHWPRCGVAFRNVGLML